MTYNPSIPQAGDLISDSQSEILTNFEQLNLVYGDTNPAADPNSDHYAFEDASANARKHRKIRLPEIASDTAAIADQGSIYTKDNGSGRTELYYRYDSAVLPAGGGSVVANLLPIKSFAQFQGNVTANPAVLNNSFNVSNINATNGNPTSTYVITFSQALPSANYGVIALSTQGGSGGSAGISYSSLLTTGFTLSSGPATAGPGTMSFIVVQFVA